MDKLNKYLLSIIKSAVADSRLEIPDKEFDWEALFQMAKEHKITCLVGLGLKDIMEQLPEEIQSKFQNEIKKNIFLDLNQEYEAQRIFEKFEQQKLRFMLMKGYNIKKIYPQTCMRYMCDIDILIEDDNYGKYDDIMKELGYEKKVESDHEHIYQKKPLINVELHKRIVPSYNTDLYKYYGNGWKFAEKINEAGRYAYSVENQYVFLIVHLAKHYQASGIGLSHFVDIFVINQKCNYDKEYVKGEIKKLGLEEFHDNVLRLIDFWFGDEAEDKKLLDMSEFVFSSGAYGNFINRAATETMKGIEKYGNETKVRRVKTIEVIFPSCKRLSENFPVLIKWPILYPICLVYRNVRAVIFRRNKVKNYMNGINYNDETHMNKLSEHLSDVGLRDTVKGSEDV